MEMSEIDPVRLLVVEDNPTVARCLKTTIQHHNRRILIDIATSLANAREKIAQNTYRYWLIDIRLPDGSGDALLFEKSRPNIVLGMSGDMIDYEIKKRFTAFFQKPFDPSQLFPFL